MINMRYIKEESFIKSMCRKMAPPLGKRIIIIRGGGIHIN